MPSYLCFVLQIVFGTSVNDMNGPSEHAGEPMITPLPHLQALRSSLLVSSIRRAVNSGTAGAKAAEQSSVDLLHPCCAVLCFVAGQRTLCPPGCPGQLQAAAGG